MSNADPGLVQVKADAAWMLGSQGSLSQLRRRRRVCWRFLFVASPSVKPGVFVLDLDPPTEQAAMAMRGFPSPHMLTERSGTTRLAAERLSSEKAHCSVSIEEIARPGGISRGGCSPSQ